MAEGQRTADPDQLPPTSTSSGAASAGNDNHDNGSIKREHNPDNEGNNDHVDENDDDDDSDSDSGSDGEMASELEHRPAVPEDNDAAHEEGMCVECDERAASVDCVECDDEYCDACFTMLHRKGWL